MESIKLKKCSVKLNRLSFIGINPDVIQEQILDQRIRKCSVRLRRCSEMKMVHLRPRPSPSCGHTLRRCFIRLPRINLTLTPSEISSPATSTASGSLISNGSDKEDVSVRTTEWVQKYN